jgi:MFS transporter, ACS family, tartrate transporter
MTRHHSETPATAGPGGAPSEAEQAATRKAAGHLLPLLGIGFLLSFLDRTNISVAALTMNAELGIGPELFGVISGVFFAGYVLFEVPSNLIMHRVGARVWLARIMVSWGVITFVTGFVTSPTALLWCRVLLGVAEAGFSPAVIFYLTIWFGQRHRSQMLGWFYVFAPVATVIGAPLGGFLVSFDNLLGLSGWRWAFLVEGVATVVLGVVYFLRLPNRPRDARWLTAPEREALTARMAGETAADKRAGRHGGAIAGLRHPKILVLCVVGIGFGFAIYGVGLWLPQLIRGSLHIRDSVRISLLTALPYLLCAIAMIYWARRCDRRGTRSFHTALPMVVGGIALALSSLAVSSPWLGYIGICLSVVGTLGSAPVYFSMPPLLVSGAASAAAIALMNTWSNVTSFVGPYLVGWVTATTGTPTIALVVIGVVLALGGVLAGSLRLHDRAGDGAADGAMPMTERPAPTPDPT